jgi:hypothetical protein
MVVARGGSGSSARIDSSEATPRRCLGAGAAQPRQTGAAIPTPFLLPILLAPINLRLWYGEDLLRLLNPACLRRRSFRLSFLHASPFWQLHLRRTILPNNLSRGGWSVCQLCPCVHSQWSSPSSASRIFASVLHVSHFMASSFPVFRGDGWVVRHIVAGSTSPMSSLYISGHCVRQGRLAVSERHRQRWAFDMRRLNALSDDQCKWAPQDR